MTSGGNNINDFPEKIQNIVLDQGWGAKPPQAPSETTLVYVQSMYVTEYG